MTHIVEYKSFRYTWELVRHTYIVDSEIEIEIRQIEISPSHESHLLAPPYPRTPFFEVEIDQIQQNGKTVFSLRNICPVQITDKPGFNFLNSLIKPGSSRVTKRFQSQEGETETRWLYVDDFFLISLSSGDRHDLDMLISLVIGKLNMIALSIQSGKRIHSEFENQEKFRTVMSTMFSEGVDGAFRDVPVYQQHGDMTDSDIDVSAALMSAEFQDLMTVCASEEGAVLKIPVVESTHIDAIVEGNKPAECTVTESTNAEPATCERVSEINPHQCVTGSTPSESIPEESTYGESTEQSITLSESIPEDNTETGNTAQSITLSESIPEDNTETGNTAQSITLSESIPEDNTETGNTAQNITLSENIPEKSTYTESTEQSLTLSESIPEESKHTESIEQGITLSKSIPEVRCTSCDAKISATTKFCGSCGAAVRITPPRGSTSDFPRIPADSGGESSPAHPRPSAEPAVNLKAIEELEDLSWLSD